MYFKLRKNTRKIENSWNKASKMAVKNANKVINPSRQRLPTKNDCNAGDSPVLWGLVNAAVEVAHIIFYFF